MIVQTCKVRLCRGSGLDMVEIIWEAQWYSVAYVQSLTVTDDDLTECN